MPVTTFTETQRFRQLWLWILLAVACAVTVVPLFAVVSDINPMNALWRIAILVMVVLLFVFLKLDTRIDEAGVYYSFTPFIRKHHIPWSSLNKAYIRKYSPVLEYGGWGIRFGGKKKGKAFNVSGNMGLQLELTDGKRIFIGTQKPDLIEALLKNIPRKSFAVAK